MGSISSTITCTETQLWPGGCCGTGIRMEIKCKPNTPLWVCNWFYLQGWKGIALLCTQIL